MQTRFLSELFIHVYSSPGIRYTLETVPCCLHSSSLLENCSQCHRKAVGVHLWWSGVVYRHDCVCSKCRAATQVQSLYIPAPLVWHLASYMHQTSKRQRDHTGACIRPRIAFVVGNGQSMTKQEESKNVLSGMVYAACAHDMALLFVNVFS